MSRASGPFRVRVVHRLRVGFASGVVRSCVRRPSALSPLFYFSFSLIDNGVRLSAPPCAPLFGPRVSARVRWSFPTLFSSVRSARRQRRCAAGRQKKELSQNLEADDWPRFRQTQFVTHRFGYVSSNETYHVWLWEGGTGVYIVF